MWSNQSHFSSDILLQGEIKTFDYKTLSIEIGRHGDMAVGLVFHELPPDQSFFIFDLEFSNIIESPCVIEGAVKLNMTDSDTYADRSTLLVPFINDTFMVSMINLQYSSVRLKTRNNGAKIKFSIIYGYLEPDLRRKIAESNTVCRNVVRNDDLPYVNGCAIIKRYGYVNNFHEKKMLIKQQGYMRK